MLSFTIGGPRLEFVVWLTRAGEPKRIAKDLPAAFHGAAWLPDSHRFLFSGSSPREGAQLYVQDIEGGSPQAVTDAAGDLRGPVVSPDGRLAAAVDSEEQVFLYPLEGGEPRPLAGAEEGEVPIQWSADGRSLYVYRPDRLPVKVFGLDVASGQRRLWKEIFIPDRTGIEGNVAVVMTPDARAYAYSVFRFLNDLHLVKGLK